MDQLSPDEFQFFIVLLAIGTAISSLIPALLMKWLMSGIFGHRVSFWLILLMLILSAAVLMSVLYVLGIFDIIMADGDVPLEVNLMLTFATFCVQLLLLTLFVPDEEMQLVSMWKWAAVIIAQALVLILIAVMVAVLTGLFASGTLPLPEGLR